MPTPQDVSNHYTHGNLAAAIHSGIESLGETIDSVTIDDLAPVDEFHIGGRQASEDFLGQLDLSHEKQVLEALQTAGFSVIAERNRRDFALAFFDQIRAKTGAAGGPPPLGLHILMGRNTPDKVQNMIQNLSNGRIAPVELIARKA